MEEPEDIIVTYIHPETRKKRRIQAYGRAHVRVLIEQGLHEGYRVKIDNPIIEEIVNELKNEHLKKN